MLTKHQIASQLKHLRSTGFAEKLAKHAKAHDLPVPYFYAIASRETNCTNILGDEQDDGFHGVGIVQIDVQHDIARKARDSGSWKTDPDPLIEFGAQILANNVKTAKAQLPGLDAQQVLKVAASGYNTGIGRAISGSKQGDSDKFTTGHDYGKDVMSRMENFRQLIAEGH